ncbi:hypothetical protein PR048_016654 [Dryococelus australis]|uniref:Uncharacterized protein n=1 Tax=Dryococelus australis TaxID=614101 RepID=A0ABQ9H7B2_9NEOP|nr:hypothetical protein PR048_016654 [Dryococelus australis]
MFYSSPSALTHSSLHSSGFTPSRPFKPQTAARTQADGLRQDCGPLDRCNIYRVTYSGTRQPEQKIPDYLERNAAAVDTAYEQPWYAARGETTGGAPGLRLKITIGDTTRSKDTMKKEDYHAILKGSLHTSADKLGILDFKILSVQRSETQVASGARMVSIFVERLSKRHPNHLIELNTRVRRQPVTSKEELKRKLTEEWNHIDQDYTKKIISNMQTHLKEKIRQKGYPTKYRSAEGMVLINAVTEYYRGHRIITTLERKTKEAETAGWSGTGMQGRGKLKNPEKTRRQAASSSTIPTCENPEANPPGLEPGSPRWEESALATAPPFID